MSSIQPILKQVNKFTVSGLTVRTQNSDEFCKETAKIPKLWQQFYASSLVNTAPIFGVYSEYECDDKGPYTLTVGVTCDNQSLKFTNVEINAGNYLVFKGAGAMPQTVIETWQRVWTYFKNENLYQRSYMTDFESYDGPNDITIYIGVEGV